MSALVVLFLSLFLLNGAYLGLSTSGEEGLNHNRAACNASCLGREEVWPPGGFNDSEGACVSKNGVEVSTDYIRRCGIYNQLTQRASLEGVNVSRNGMEFTSLGVIPVEGKPFHYSITVTNFSSNDYKYLVIAQESSNRTALKQMVNATEEIDLSGLICSTLQISYAVYSNSTTVEPLIAPPVGLTVRPRPPENIRTAFEEDFSLIQHALLNISWDMPEDTTSLCHYVIRLDKLPGSKDTKCRNQKGYYEIIDKYQNSHMISAPANDSNAPPLYNCKYSLLIEAYPGGAVTNKTVEIKYTGPKSTAEIQCHAEHNPITNTYDIKANWTLSDPLAEEAAEQYYINACIQESPDSRFSCRHIEESVQYVKERCITYEKQPVITRADARYRIEMTVVRIDRKNNLYYYRKSLLPNPMTEFLCSTFAPPVKPTVIRDMAIIDLSYLSDVLEFNVSWNPPQFSNGKLQGYEIMIFPSNGTFSERALFWKTLSANLTSWEARVHVRLEDIGDTDELKFQMRAVNQYDLQSSWSFITMDISDFTSVAPVHATSPPLDGDLPVYGSVLIAVGIILLIIVLVVTVFSIICVMHLFKRRQLKFDDDVIILTRKGSTIQWPMVLNPLRSTFSFDPWEILPEDIRIHEDQPLGKGCYGEVHKGILSGRKRGGSRRGGSRSPRFSLTSVVAVKRLQKNSTSLEKSNFLKEIEMMKKVSSSDNKLSKFVVNMVGCITLKEPMILILEFMKHGNLLDYLRATKAKANAKKATPYLEPTGAYSELSPSEERYSGLEALEERNLLEFARQIAAGMEYLSSLNIIHRDLACRNILVGESNSLKISDFGMSRYLTANDVYINTSHGLLPIRWMSVESLFHREFTSASDVWSYGVLLWEICTLGGYPYPNYANKDIPRLLRQGYRMRKPKNCSADVYDIMLHCWSESSQDRPEFSELHKVFDKFLGIHMQDRYPYIELQVNQPYKFDRLAPETGQDSDGYNEDGESPVDLSGDEEEEETFKFKLSPVPQKSISKLSVLSSSLCQLTPESEKQPKPTTDDQSTHESENDIKEDVNLFDDGQYDTLAPPPTPPSTKDNDIMMRTRTSSFHDDLMSHFERRLSDLGPRSKYPYLQQLDRNREKGLSAKGGDALGAGHSEEVLSKKRTGGRDKKWLKYTFSAK